eukprot:1142355-Pelagomonas_calceolata.AAC.2
MNSRRVCTQPCTLLTETSTLQASTPKHIPNIPKQLGASNTAEQNGGVAAQTDAGSSTATNRDAHSHGTAADHGQQTKLNCQRQGPHSQAGQAEPAALSSAPKALSSEHADTTHTAAPPGVANAGVASAAATAAETATNAATAAGSRATAANAADAADSKLGRCNAQLAQENAGLRTKVAHMLALLRAFQQKVMALVCANDCGAQDQGGAHAGASACIPALIMALVCANVLRAQGQGGAHAGAAACISTNA